MNDEQIKEALKIIREPITVHQENYKYFDEENYNKLLMVYENCQWFINNWEQLEINVKDLQKQLEAYENMRKETRKFIINHRNDRDGEVYLLVKDVVNLLNNLNKVGGINE